MKKIIGTVVLFAAVFACLVGVNVFTVNANNGLIDRYLWDTSGSAGASNAEGGGFILEEKLLVAKEGDVVECECKNISNSITIPYGVTLTINLPADYGAEGFLPFTIESGVTVTVDGSLFVGSKSDVISPFSEKQAYSLVFLEGKIVVNGVAECYLPISGSGEIIVNGTYKEPFYIIDAPEKDKAEGYFENAEKFPFNEYALLTSRCKKTINCGGKNIGVVYSDGFSENEIPIISKERDSVLQTEEGSRVIFTPSLDKSIKQTVEGENLSFIFKTTISLCGKISTGNFKISFYGHDFSADKCVFTIPYNFDVSVEKDAAFTVSEFSKLRVLPGATLKVEEGSTLKITGSLDVLGAYPVKSNRKVFYPDINTLSNYGFSKSGDLICNGNLEIVGGFTGIVQTTSDNAQISISETANLQSRINDDFVDYVYNDKTYYTQSAEVYALNGYIRLEPSNNYKSYAISPFSLDFVLIYNDDDKENAGEKQYVYQSKIGRFLKCDEDKYTVMADFFLPEKIGGVKVNVNGKDYTTDLNGSFLAEVTFTKDSPKVYYYTSAFENQCAVKECLLLLDTTVYLNKVVEDINLFEGNDYEINYQTPESRYFATVNYYGGDSENIEVYPKYSDDGYVKHTYFVNDNYLYNPRLKHDLYFYEKELDDYKNAYNGLIDADLSEKHAKEVYNKYLNLIENRTEKEVRYINEKLASFIDFNYVVDIIGGAVTYGDTEAEMTAVKLDGGKEKVFVKVDGYTYEGGDITAVISYSGVYKNVDYIFEKKIVNVKPRQITYALNDAKSAYLDEIAPLSGKIIKGSLAFSDDINFIKIFTDAYKGAVVGDYAVYGKCESPFYSVKFANATYEVVKKGVDVCVCDKTTYFSFSKNIAVSYTETSGSVKGFNVFYGDEKVAIIDLYGNLSAALAVGTYRLEPIIDEINYYLCDVKTATLTVLTDDERYSVGFGFFDGSKKEYDARPIEFNVSVYDKALEKTVEPSEYDLTVTRGGNKCNDFVNVGVYEFTVTIGGKSFSNNYVVYPKKLRIDAWDVSIFYGEDYPNFKFRCDEEIPDGILTFSVKDGKITAKSLDANYEVAITTGSVTILPRKIEVSLTSTSKVYGDDDTPMEVALVSGTLYKDDCLSSILKLGRSTGEDVGTYSVDPIFVDENYDVTLTNADFTIYPRKITIACDYKEFTYGDKISLTGSVVSGSLAKNDDLSDVITLYKSEGTDVGVYKIYHKTLSDNYDVTYISDVIEIIPKRIEVEISDAEKIYGEVDDFNNIFASLPYGEDPKSIVDITREQGETVGVYKIFAEKSKDTNNYIIDFKLTQGGHSLLTVLPREITITLNDVTAEFCEDYRDLEKRFGFTLSNGSLVRGDRIILEYALYKDGNKADAEIFGTKKSIGDYKITAEDKMPNYNVTIIAANLGITKIKVSLSMERETYVYNSESLFTFDYSKYIDGDRGYADENSFYVAIYVNDGGETVKADDVINVGNYVIMIEIADTDIFEFENAAAHSIAVSVLKADIGEYIKIDIPYGEYIIIGDNRPIAQLLDYNCLLLTKYYDENGTLSEIEKEGNYTIEVYVADDNYKGSVSVYVAAYFDVKPKIDEITSNLETAKVNPSQKYKALKAVKEILLSFSYGDKKQIEDKPAYKSVIDDFTKEYADFVAEENEKSHIGKVALNGALNRVLYSGIALSLAALLAFIKKLAGVLK